MTPLTPERLKADQRKCWVVFVATAATCWVAVRLNAPAWVALPLAVILLLDFLAVVLTEVLIYLHRQLPPK